MAESSFDVVVAGSGINGAATFFHLVRGGLRVALVEREHPASGPTGRSSAITSQYYGTPELAELGHRGTECLRNLEELTGTGADYHQVGMMWACGPESARGWESLAVRLASEGLPVEVVSAEQIVEMAPSFVPDGLALGIWESNCGYADPATATNAFVNAGRDGGGEVFLHSEVRSLLVEGSRAAGVELADGRRISAGSVVLALGVWTKALVAELGVDLPLTIERHPHAVVAAPELAESILPFAWYDDTRFHYARPEGENLILVGEWSGGGNPGPRNPEFHRAASVSDPERYEESVGLAESEKIVELMSPRVPRLRELGIRPGYAGLYDMSPDDEPIIGPLPGYEDLIVIAGTSGHGFKLGPAVGEEVARLLTSGEAPLLAAFPVERLLT